MSLDARGFTVVEAIIGLAIAAILGGALMSLLMAQDRFYGRLDSDVAAQQNLRAAADIVSSELRMNGPDDVIAAAADSVSVRFDVFHAVVCDITSSNTVALFIYDSMPATNLAVSTAGTAYARPYQSLYDYAPGWIGSPGTGPGARTDCMNAGAPGTAPNANYRYVTGWASGFAGIPPRGSIVRRYRQLTYRFAPSALGNGTALYRGNQELIGPLDATSAFEYVMMNGTVQSNVASGNLGAVRVIRIIPVAIDDDPRFDFTRLLTFDIPLRN